MNVETGKNVGEGGMERPKAGIFSKGCRVAARYGPLIPAAVLLFSCATGGQRGQMTGSEERTVHSIREEGREILGQYAVLPEDERVPELIYFSYIFRSIYESGATAPEEAWPQLAEPVWPILLAVLESKQDDSSGDIFAQGPALKMIPPLEIEEAIPVLRGMLGDRSVYVVRQAIDALGRLGDEDSIPAIREKLEPKVRPGRFGGGVDMTTPRYAALAIWRLGDTQGKEILEAYLEHPAQSVRVEAATALAEMGNADGIRALETRLQNPGMFRITVLEALGRLDTSRATELLEREMNVGEMRGRLLAASYLAERGDPGARRFLVEAVQNDEIDYAYLAAMYLARIRDRRSVPILEQMYQNVDIEKRLAASAALAAMGSEVGYRDLVEGLRDEVWAYRAIAGAMLLIIEPPEGASG